MKLSFLILFSFFITGRAYSASCCVANTSLPNLMILPADWQATWTLAASKVIGDVNTNGQSTFRNSQNKDQTQAFKLDLSYRWSDAWQTGISSRYQKRDRDFQDSQAENSSFGDLGLSQAYQFERYHRLFTYVTVNIPTGRSIYDTRQNFAVDAQSTGLYSASLGMVKFFNYEQWDLITAAEAHRSLGRSFNSASQGDLEVRPTWGSSINLGAGYTPWKKKYRFGLNITPRYEAPKVTVSNSQIQTSDKSLVWDSGLNITYTIAADQAVGLRYIDQTVIGPVRNSTLTRTIAVLYQVRWL